MRKILIVFTFFLTTNLTLLCCKSTAKTVNSEKVKIGKEFDKAIEISLNDFFQIWMLNDYSKGDENCWELFKDDNFTYFGDNEFKKLEFGIKRKLYKIKSQILLKNFPNHRKIDARTINQEFFNEIIPNDDMRIYVNSGCSTVISNPKYSYKLKNSEIQITLLWKYICDEKKLIDKTYKGNYNLNKMEFKK